LSARAGEDAEAMEELKRRKVPPPVDDWKYQFAGTGRLFYKCPLATRLDAEIGDVAVAARELELELLLGVVERLRRFEPKICRVAQVLADVDVLAALAVAASQLNWRCPKLSASKPGLLRIVRGRHPLIEGALTTHHGFIPNDTYLGVPYHDHHGGAGRSVDGFVSDDGDPRDRGGSGDSRARGAQKKQRSGERPEFRGDPHERFQGDILKSVQVVTGGNLAGKSVYLKQVGLIVFLAQIGSFVPAEEAEIGLCDFLFSRIQSLESAAIRCSSFGIDLTQVSLAFRHATEASLVLLDEFGKGTHASDGVALLGASVEHLCRRRPGPKAIITTHFTEIFRFGLVSQEEPALQLSHIRVLAPETEDAEVAYLYQLVPGVADRSFGLECARRAGLNAETLARAAEILRSLERGEEVAPPKEGPCADAAAVAESREEQHLSTCRIIIDRLCSIDPGNGGAVRALLDFVRSNQQVVSRLGG